MPKKKSRHAPYDKRDANEKEILAEMDKLGIRYWKLPPGTGADLIVQNPSTGCNGFAEVKNPAYSSPHPYGDLTERELEFYKWCEAAGIEYRVLYYIEDVRHWYVTVPRME